MKILKDTYAFIHMLKSLKVFRPEKEFKNKRVAVIGAADSAFDEINGDYIDSFDLVVRINKAPHYWDKSKAKYIGSKFTHLFHSYFENQYSGGGPLDWKLYDDLGIEKVINPNNSLQGLNTHYSYYKRHSRGRKTYILSRKNYKVITENMQGYIPTVGYTALKSVLQSNCKEIYITGFTFFRTPYAKGYRKELENQETNKQHIRNQGIHNPEIELKNLRKALQFSPCKNIHMDRRLRLLLSSEGPKEEKRSEAYP